MAVMATRKTASNIRTFGEWLRSARESARYSIRGLADELGCSHTHIANIERDDAKPSREMVQQIATLTSSDAAAGMALAGYSVSAELELPDNWADYPLELRQALAYQGKLSPESQRYVAKLYLEHIQAELAVSQALQDTRERLLRIQSESN